jgi:hypothetical protein
MPQRWPTLRATVGHSSAARNSAVPYGEGSKLGPA